MLRASIFWLAGFVLLGCGPSQRGGTVGQGDAPDLGGEVDDGAMLGDASSSSSSTDQAANSDDALIQATADGGGIQTFNQTCSGSITVSGTVYAPNGVDPVAKALVYVPRIVNPMPTGPACDLCVHPLDPSYAVTTAGADGAFSLDLGYVPAGSTVQLAVTKGHFRRVTNVSVQCGPNIPPKLATTLPGKSSDGDIPKIAVGTGTLDHLDQVLDALGITEFTCLEGRKNTSSSASCKTTGKLSDLLTSQNGLTLDDYNMVFIGCAPGAYANYASAGVSTQTITTNLQAWAGKGGRLFVTDNSYDYVAEAFPQALAWQGPTGMPWMVDGANVGVSASSLSATVDDPDLAAWLKVVGVSTSPTVTVSGLPSKWSVQSGPVPMGTSELVNATASFSQNNSTSTTDVPLTSQFKANQCGKVIYSSYHTLSTVNQSALSPQEKILEYLILEAAACTRD